MAADASNLAAGSSTETISSTHRKVLLGNREFEFEPTPKKFKLPLTRKPIVLSWITRRKQNFLSVPPLKSCKPSSP
jgi:hypothetical protein